MWLHGYANFLSRLSASILKIAVMIRKMARLSHKILLFILFILIAVAGVIFFKDDKSKTVSSEYPIYVSFVGNYVFNSPKDYVVDERSVPGAQLIYTGTVIAKTVEDVYKANGITVQPVRDLTDTSADGFKEYVNNKFSQELQKSASADEVKASFAKANGIDNARVTATKSGEVVRFVYLKGGQHPAQIVAKNESEAVKKIEDTIVDVEPSSFNNESEPIKQSLKNAAQLIKDKKSVELYGVSAPSLRQSTTQESMASILEAAAPFSAGNITILGGNYRPGEFIAILSFSPSEQGKQLAYGTLAIKKFEDRWKVEVLTLPTKG